jgi:AmpD protein
LTRLCGVTAGCPACAICRNFGPRPAQAQVDLLVVHSISLPPGQFGTGCVQQLFTNQLDWDAHYFQGIRGLEVSSHFFIERTGRLAVCRCRRARLACGRSSWRGRGNLQ